jgi:UDP-glucose 4-epimerase|tara:strand:+ start:58 stop:963 length:906 start_codon:yes stop_codon:yes gene_type:complete
MKAAVFGGSGFLGSHVADELTERGYKVRVYDIRRSPHLQKDQKMITGDILDADKVRAAVEGCDAVYNFAGISDIAEASINPLETIKINIFGNATILDACRLQKVKRFIFASSLYIYSAAGSFYRSSKQASELIIENYNEKYGLPFTILRYGSLYGPRAGESNWIYSILKQAVADGKITRYGDGEELREYIHVKDAARYSVDVLSPEFEKQYVIITGNQQMKVKDLLTMIKEMLNNKVKLEFLPIDSSIHYEVTPYSFNPRIAKRLVGKHYIDLGQGLLDILRDVHEKHSPYKKQNDLYFKE